MTPHLLVTTARMAAIRLAVPGALYHLPQPLRWHLGGREGVAEAVVLVLDDLQPGTDYTLRVEGFAPLPFTTAPCAGLVEPALTPGDDPQTTRRNAQALAHAVAATPKGGTLRLPPGLWHSLPVALRSDMTLHLSHGATLAAPALREGWPILPAHDTHGMLGSWEGLPDACFAAPLHAIRAERLVIEGPGVLDGGGAEGDWWTWPKGTRNGARRPRGLHLIGCRDVTLLGFTIRNAPSWTIHPQGCTRLAACGLHIQAPPDSPNTDGFNPESCRDVVMEGIRFSVGDDCIAVKAGKRGPGGEAGHLAETRGIIVRHCLMERGHGGLVIGSEMSGGVQDVTLEDCHMQGTDRGLRLKTRRGRGGSIGNITFRRVHLDGVQTALSANAHYHCDADGHDDWVQSRSPAPVTDQTPQIDGITIEDVTIDNLSHAAGCFLGLPEAPIRNLRIRRLTIRSLNPDAQATPPIMADHIWPMRHEGLTAQHCQLETDAPDQLSSTQITR